MPSPFLRLPQKTCGLFDKGFAGSASADAASFGVNAPAADPFSAASTGGHVQLLADFEPGLVLTPGDSYHLHHLPGVNSVYTDIQGQAKTKTSLFEQPAAAVASSSDASALEGWGELEDSFGDLETDQLGNDSLDAFINLDQLLMGDAFLDEVSEVKPEIDMTPHTVEPVISIPSPTGGNNIQQLDFFDLLDSATEVTPVFQDPSPSFSVIPAAPAVKPSSTALLPPVTNKVSTSRKRKAPSKASHGPIKTSMFEIPKPISENVVSTTTTTAIFTSPCSPELDHDYTSKSKMMEVSLEESTSKAGFEVDKDEPEVVGVTDKQSIRRHKNNIASKRSREQRKQKFTDLDREAEELIEKNASLRLKIAELEKVAREMKAVLVAKMSGK